MSELQIVSYSAIIFFAVVVAAKVVRIARMPIHIRWDLYPIPHEKGKGAYGGSYYEEIDWWTKPNNFSLVGELKAMAKEIFFVHSVYENNRPLWFFSFPFHIGMYCLVGLMVLLVIGAIMGAAGLEVSAAIGGFGMIVHYLTAVLGMLGWLLAAFGAVGLLFIRMFRKELKQASVRSDYVNLLFLLALFTVGIVSWATVDPACVSLRGFVRSLITLEPSGALPTAVAVQLWLFAALLFYFPFTHMTHMFGKYFTYHKIRWEDEPNVRGGKIEKAVTEALGYQVTWAAPHIKSGVSWAEAATDWEKDSKDE